MMNFTHSELVAMSAALNAMIDIVEEDDRNRRHYLSSLEKVSLLLKPTSSESISKSRRSAVTAPDDLPGQVFNDPVDW